MENILPSISEEILVNMLSTGDKNAFENLYVKYKERLYYYCFSILSDSNASEDLVQDTFIKVWETRESVQSQMSFSSYLFTIIHNKAITYLRRLQIEKETIDYWTTEYSKPDESIIAKMISGEYESFFEKVTEKLPPKRKIVFRLSREERLSHKEIAKRLGISVYTVQEYISETLNYFKINLLKHPDLKTTFSKTPNNRTRTKVNVK